MGVTISLCMIVKNEEEVLARCLDSVKDAVDEIIIVDTGSTDRTKEIAARYTEKIYDFEWIHDFGAARNFAYSKAAMDYQMWLDADDILPADSVREIQTLKRELDPGIDFVTMKYCVAFDGAGQPTYSYARERLTKREKNFQWQDPVHECIAMVGSQRHTEIQVWHMKPHRPGEGRSTRNLDIYAKHEQKHELTPRQLYYYARELRDHELFERAAHYFERFLETKRGWSEDNIASCIALAVCYQKIGKPELAPEILIKSFEYDAPRAEACCSLGYIHKEKQEWQKALRWFDLATRLPTEGSLGFVNRNFWEYVPHIEACVCLSALGRYQEAHRYNEKAAQFMPNDPGVLSNRKYLLTKI